MREIKFRYWQPDKRKMIVGVSLVELITSGIIAGLRSAERPKTRSEISDQFKNDIFMQYTGLKDKNGKEIYEGDIVRAFDDWGGKKGDPDNGKIYPFDGVVEWGGYGCGACHGVYGWHINAKQSNELNGWDCPNINDIEEAEVIGNIYENPELIK